MRTGTLPGGQRPLREFPVVSIDVRRRERAAALEIFRREKDLFEGPRNEKRDQDGSRLMGLKKLMRVAFS